ncbi:type 2 isopentenyl-diphosphate Delta-isomerase [Porticoccaceae bacterium]|jgi:isopentenyl-diphosphate delta-isomerase|nr:type 2 isopentenyl-diphosphate Delta-isomerase [Porticoccaceae bacterium]MDB9952655.1 type 2 isopentenyl-diphosphate Delta-isomerase [Porticoccaceae bacterium]MDB9999753.1 type 2 isopentenyl-diphosphate Delta-isomerase [Porticoccaceae bacterium]MDC0004006.1 type 2 isopentenyl-diphosphate Delta-isomerase [Porticoccaceae bacterium]
MTNISNRKDDHIQLALEARHQSQSGSHFDRLTFEHSGLPEQALEDTDIACHFLGRPIAAPFMIGAMTGGCNNGELINQHLAEAAEYCHIPMALGSQRAALEQGLAQNVRRWAPNAIILGNLGATQLQQSGLDLAKRAVESVAANALIIHINPLQELVQPNGDRDWNGVLDAIQTCASELSVPVIVKEVGSGIGPSTAQKLVAAGVQWIEVAGRGGTSWASIELARNDSTREQQIAAPFVDWGMDTVELLSQVRSACADVNMIGSGGVRNGVDIAKCIRLGAQMSALAQPFLGPALESSEAVIEKIEILQEQLRWTMFLTASQNLMALRSAPLI